MAAGTGGNRWPVRAPIDGVVPVPFKVQLDGANDPTFVHGVEFFNPPNAVNNKGVLGPTSNGATGLFKFNLLNVTANQGFMNGVWFGNGAELFLDFGMGDSQAVIGNATIAHLAFKKLGQASFVQNGYFYVQCWDTTTGAAANPPAKTDSNNVVLEGLLIGNEQVSSTQTGQNAGWASRGTGV